MAEYGDVDATLMSPSDVDNHNRAIQQPGDKVPFGHYDLDAEVDHARLRKEIGKRFAWLGKRFANGKYVDVKGGSMDPVKLGGFNLGVLENPPEPTLHLALQGIQIHCAPTPLPYYTPSLDLRFNRNFCSTIHPQELLQVLGQWPNGMRLVRTRYVYGWIKQTALLTPPIPVEKLKPFVRGPWVQATGNVLLTEAPELKLSPGTKVPVARPSKSHKFVRVHYGTADGVFESRPIFKESLRPTARPLTRRAFVEEVFQYLGSPYGWGGTKGGRDCSRLVMDTFASFGLQFPRHSGSQPYAGTFRIEMSKVKSERERALLIDSAAKRGIVLLHFPGHVMLYLGRTEAGTPMAIHAFAEYVEPCGKKDPRHPARSETLMTVDNVAVSNLELGRGSSRGAFIERITHITVLGHSAGFALQGSAKNRPAAPVAKPKRCRSRRGVAVFSSPRRPHSKGEFRVIATAAKDLGPVELVVLGPRGVRHTPTIQHFGGPPYSYVVRIDSPRPGRYVAVLGDGKRVDGCRAFWIRRHKRDKDSGSLYAWDIRRQWGEGLENLYAAFVESLFSHPLDQDLTWKNLKALVQDRERNLLYDHLSLGEDDGIRLQPDCADLPYLLRAYFAWKMGLPFGYRFCNRGRTGRPPTCGKLNTNQILRGEVGDTKAFSTFARRKVQNAVHSASGRTHPNDDRTDYYPVPLTRRALRPGTLYADPHGHVLLIARWLPQGVDTYGTLVAADAQPDGTIGRRRFWRGSFLFSPDTTNVGAGFKAFRPVISRDDEFKTLANKALKGRGGFAAFSRQQYQSSVDDFYDAMAGLINPRPLDPNAMQLQLVDALQEAVVRRVVSVNNGEDFMKKRKFKPIEMPRGYSLFETIGPWEDFSTPARDMRLLISIDTVMKFAGRVGRKPERYGLNAEDDLDAAMARIRKTRDEGLKARRFKYIRSDGSEHELTLQDIVSRTKRFEVSYNPNDCAEIRWAAPPGSTEMNTCQRHAPDAQRKRMSTYRAWFIARQRPPR